MTLAKVVRKGSYQGVSQWGISTGAEITPSKATATKWAMAENNQNAGIGRSKAAKARKLGEFTTWRVYVIGHAWGGFKGTYSYTYDHAPTEQFIKTRAGDFESLIDWQIVMHRKIVYSDGERTIVTKVRDWQLEDSVDFYCDANGC